MAKSACRPLLIRRIDNVFWYLSMGLYFLCLFLCSFFSSFFYLILDFWLVINDFGHDVGQKVGVIVVLEFSFDNWRQLWKTMNDIKFFMNYNFYLV